MSSNNPISKGELSRSLFSIVFLSTLIAFPSSVEAVAFSQTNPFSGSGPSTGFNVTFGPSINWLFNSFGYSVSGSLTDGVDMVPISNANVGRSNDTFTDGLTTNESLSISAGFGSYSIPTACPAGQALHSEPGYGIYCVPSYSEPLTNVGVKAGGDYSIPTACPAGQALHSEPGYGIYCVPSYSEPLRNVGVMAPRPVTYSGSVSLTGDATPVKISMIGGSGLCPSGTYVYGVNASLVDRRDTPATQFNKIFCGAFQNPSVVDTSVAPRAVGFGNGVSRCGGNEFTQGFYLTYSGADNLNWYNVGGMYCGRLRSGVAQEDSITAPSQEDLVSMIMGIFDMRIPVARAQSAGSVALPGCNGCSASVGAGVENMVIGFNSNIAMGSSRRSGPRIQLSEMYTRIVPTGPTAELTADPGTIDSGESSTLTWRSTNAASCTSMGGFSTGGATSGRESTGVLTSTQSYQVRCSDMGISADSNIATVTVLQPTVSISAAPSRVVRDSSGSGATSVSWNATSVNTCTITRNGIVWQTLTASPSRTISGSDSDTITGQATYAISCTNNSGAGAASATQIVNVVSSFQEF